MPVDVLACAPRGAAGVLSAVMLAGFGLWGLGAPLSQVQATSVANAAPQVLDESTSTVSDIIAHQYDTDRFYLLLLETGTLAQISGVGPYVVYAPDNSAFDYLPPSQYLDLSYDQKEAMAQAQIGNVPLPQGVYVLQEIDAENGVIYLINEVLPVVATSTEG